MQGRAAVAACALVFLAACGIGGNAGRAEPLELTLSLDKTAYSPGQEVVATVVLKNIGGQNLLINSYMAVDWPYMPSPVPGMAFTVIDSSGKAHVLNGFMDPFRPPHIDDFVVLKAGGAIERNFLLMSSMYDFSAIGTYTVLANYHNPMEPGALDPSDRRIAWKGDLDSNTVSFTVGP